MTRGKEAMDGVRVKVIVNRHGAGVSGVAMIPMVALIVLESEYVTWHGWIDTKNMVIMVLERRG